VLAHLPGRRSRTRVYLPGALRNASIEPPAHVLEQTRTGVEKRHFMNGQSVQSVD